METPSSNAMVLQVTIPENASVGDKITIQCPDERYFEFVIPSNTNSGDVVNVLVPDSKNQSNLDNTDTVANSEGRNKFGLILAGATISLVGALVVGPVLTGIIVLGSVLYVSKFKANEGDIYVGHPLEHDNLPEEPSSSVKSIKVPMFVTKAVDRAYEKWVELDDIYHISSKSLSTLAQAQEYDEKNKISETVIATARNIDLKYDISGKAQRVAAAGVVSAQTVDQRFKISKNTVECGGKFYSCFQDMERKYDVSGKMVTAANYGAEALVHSVNKVLLSSSNGNEDTGPIINNEDTGPMKAPVTEVLARD